MSSSNPCSNIIYLDLDVHNEFVTLAVLSAGAAKPTSIDRYSNDVAKLRKVAVRMAQEVELRACC